MKSLAIIPARGGSKGIPRKNIADINGRPLIAWSIAQALASGHIDYVHVSTDNEEIAEVALAAGAHCDFLRPSELAGDRIGTGEAILHSICELERLGHKFDAVVELQPTYCFRGNKLIADCLQLLSSDTQIGSVFTSTRVEDTGHPEFALQLSPDGLVQFGPKKPDQFSRQFLRDVLACQGIVIAARIHSYVSNKSFFADSCRTVLVDDPIRALDINVPLDLEIARFVASRHPEHLQ